MVAPKYKAIALDNREEIIDAMDEFNRLRPNKDKILLLINLFNQVHNAELMTMRKFNTCGDCRNAIKTFWTYVIKEWKKK